MKYLKYRNQFLNEGFSSKSLSKTLGWLNKSGLKSTSNKFLEDLKGFCEFKNIPLAEISDEWFKTNILKRDAVKLRAPEEVANPSGFWCLKFWFSAHDGYMGYTVTPTRSKEKMNNNRRSFLGESFNDEEIQYLLNNGNIDDIETGELHPVIDYKALKTGDIVCGYNNSSDYINDLRWFKVFLSYSRQGNFGGGFLFNPNINGSGISRNYDENGQEIDMNNYFGRYYDRHRGSSSWQFIGSDGSISPDHCKLHLYKPSDEPLHVVSDVKEKEIDINSFNLALENYSPNTTRLDNLNGQYNDWSIDNNRFKNSDFAIIFYLDDFLPNQKKDLNDIRTDRTKSKEGALALMSDDEIKRINVEKRMNYLVDKFDLDPSIKMDNISNLNSILIKIFLDDFILFSIHYGYSDSIIESIYRFFDACEHFEQSPEYFKERIEPYISRVKDSYKHLLKRYSSLYPRFKKNYNQILKSDNIYSVEIFKELMKLSKKLIDKIRTKNIVNLHDASIIIERVRSLVKMPSTFNLPYYLNSSLEEFGSSDYSLRHANRMDENEFNRAKKSLKFIERQIDIII